MRFKSYNKTAFFVKAHIFTNRNIGKKLNIVSIFGKLLITIRKTRYQIQNKTNMY